MGHEKTTKFGEFLNLLLPGLWSWEREYEFLRQKLEGFRA